MSTLVNEIQIDDTDINVDDIINELNGNDDDDNLTLIPSKPQIIEEKLDQNENNTVEEEDNKSDKEENNDYDFCDSKFWYLLVKGLKDPFVVGIIVAILSSSRIQMRVAEVLPIFSGDNIQSLIIRIIIAMGLFILIKKLI